MRLRPTSSSALLCLLVAGLMIAGLAGSALAGGLSLLGSASTPAMFFRTV